MAERAKTVKARIVAGQAGLVLPLDQGAANLMPSVASTAVAHR